MTRSHPEANYPCDCDVLDRAADEPDTPIIFDAQTNEYQLVHCEGHGVHMVFYYCPFCGGRTPDTRRSSLFARITHAEAARLRELVKDIQSLDDAYRILGKPDAEFAHGETRTTPDSDTEPTQVESYCTLQYSNLSETTLVQITDYRKDRVGVRFIAKPLAEGEADKAAMPAVRTKDSPALKDHKAGKQTIYCSFCGQSEHGVERMLQSRAAAICSGCAEVFIQRAAK